jgi:hypothetical protein
VTGKHQVNLEHNAGTTDRGFLLWSRTPADCTPPDTERSYFSVPSDLPTASGNPAYEMTMFTQSAFTVPPGGGVFTVFLNSLMQSGNSPNDVVGNDRVNIEFHTIP